jgi:hypothetical protein
MLRSPETHVEVPTGKSCDAEMGNARPPKNNQLLADMSTLNWPMLDNTEALETHPTPALL